MFKVCRRAKRRGNERKERQSLLLTLSAAAGCSEVLKVVSKHFRDGHDAGGAVGLLLSQIPLSSSCSNNKQAGSSSSSSTYPTALPDISLLLGGRLTASASVEASKWLLLLPLPRWHTRRNSCYNGLLKKAALGMGKNPENFIQRMCVPSDDDDDVISPDCHLICCFSHWKRRGNLFFQLSFF